MGELHGCVTGVGAGEDAASTDNSQYCQRVQDIVESVQTNGLSAKETPFP